MMRKSGSYRKPLFYGILFLALTVLYGLCHQKISISSDTTTILPMSEDFLRGNFLLKGWVLGTNNFYFTEMLPYAVGLLLGFSPSVLLGWVPGMAWAFIAAASLELLDFSLEDRKRCLVFAVLFAGILLIVPLCAGYTVLNANTHNNLYAFLALYLLWLKKYLQTGSLKRLAAMTVLAGLLSFSESVTNMVLIAPVAVLAIYDVLFKKQKGKLWLLGSVAVSYAIGKGIFLLFQQTGSMETVGFPIALASPELIPGRVAAWINQLAILLGEEWLYSGTPDLRAVLTAALIAVYVIFLLAQLFRLKKLTDIELCLYLIAAGNAAACIFTDVPVYHRYCVPMYYFGILLMLEMFASAVSRTESKRLYALLLAASSALGLCTAVDKAAAYLRAEDYGFTQKAVARLLRDEGLERGYADFWCASQLSYFTDYQVDIFPMWVTTDTIRLAPYTELIRHDWYGMRDFRFVINYADESREGFVNTQKLFEILGAPARTETVGEYAIHIWEKDISSWMMNGFADGVLRAGELLANEQGSIEDDRVLLDPGGIAYGPYCHMDAGTYRFTFTGENLDVLSYDVYADGELFETEQPALSDGKLEYTVSFDQDTDNVEFRFYNFTEEKASVFGAAAAPAA